jgi:hypothetical protein
VRIVKFCLVSVLLCCCMVSADPSRYIIEDHMTNVAQQTMDAMYGKGSFVAKVSVQMSDTIYEERHTKQANVGKGKNKQSANALPGLPSLSFTPETSVPYDSKTYIKSGKIKKILVRLLVNKSFPKSKARKAEKALSGVLGLNPDRGDTVEILYEKFYYDQDETKQKIEISTTGDEKLASYQNLFYLLMIIFIIVFLVIYIIFQLKQAKLLKESQDAAGGGGTSVNVNPSLELPEGMGGGGAGGKLSMSGSPSIKQYFDFIDNSNLENFIFLLKKEKIKAEYVSMIVSFVEPRIGAKIIKELELEEQAVVASQLMDQKLASRSILDKLESKLKDSLESFFGGESKFKTIFDMVSGDDKRKIMEVLQENDSVGYQKFRKFVILFDDLVLLEDEEMEKIVSDINLDLLATALISVDQDVYQRFDENLNKSAKEMVSQFLELKSGATSQAEIEKAQDYILKIVKKLDDSGNINLSGKIGSEE